MEIIEKSSKYYRMSNKKLLLIAPDWMGLHEDIIEGLKHKGYCVDFIAEKRYPYDPFYRLAKRRHQKTESEFLSELQLYWTNILSKEDFNKAYDYLFVVDGQALHPCIFDVLEQRNSSIKKVNFLFDRVQGVYDFDRYFNRFHRVFTFDPTDANKFGIELFQIYWVPGDNTLQEEYNLFGFGAYSRYRYDFFSELAKVFVDSQDKNFIKLYAAPIQNEWMHEIKNYVRKALGYTPNISRRELHSGMITHESIKPEEFRGIIYASNVVVDTSAPYQEGLTARFMWSLGAGKKIITTNQTVVNYSFYSPEQIFVIDKDKVEEHKDKIRAFAQSDCVIEDRIHKEVEKYRIDNWINHLLG